MLHWLEQIYRDHRTQLFRCAWIVLRNQEKAEDAVHAAFARSLRLRARPVNEKAYMLVAVRNAALDLKRRETKHFVGELQTEEVYDSRVIHGGFYEQLESLELNKREVIELRLRVGLSFVEIAELLKEPVSTVTSRYKRAIQELRVLHGVIHE